MLSQLAQQQIMQMTRQGLAALQQKKPQEARDLFEKVIKEGGATASSWLVLGYACRDLNDVPAMLDAVDRSLAIQPRNPRAFILKADHFSSAGDMQAAAAFYLRAVNVAPPAAQTPPDLQAELVRAQNRFNELSSEFERHLNREMKAGLAEAGRAGGRIRDSIDLITGKKQLPPPTAQFPSQPKNYFMPGLPHFEFYDDLSFEWVADVEAATDDIRDELLSVLDEPDTFAPYVTGAENRPQADPHGMKNNNNWSAFYLWKDGEPVEENAAKCPKTVEALKRVPFTQLPNRAPNVLFSVLRAGAVIPPHNGLINNRFICHLPLIVPDGCGFRVGTDTREWEEGKVWVFDDSVQHEAWNKSDEDRYILLFEIWRPEVTEVEQKLIGDIFSAIDSYSSQ